MNCTKYKILFFDLDGTLLNSQKCISDITAQSILRCKEKGIRIAVCTSRCESNSLAFIEKINPDIIISSGGALVKIGNQYIFRHEFDSKETKAILQQIRTLIGDDCEITIDTANANYWNYKINPNTTQQNWGDSVYTDFSDFDEPALKICAEIIDDGKASEFFDCFSDYDCVRFSDGKWYKITKKNITKENAIRDVVSYYGYDLDEVISFGDDFADIGMLKMSGLGVAMGNSLHEVKESADVIIGTNDENGIALFLNQYIL